MPLRFLTARLAACAALPAALLCTPTAMTAEASDDWYDFQSTAPTEPGLIGLTDWLEAPAGKHGRILREGEELVYNGRPIRLWGLNNCFAACAPPRDLADRRARFYAKYGINSVRLHKYADGSGWAGILERGSFTRFDPEGLDRMDYYIAQLKEHGIYVKFSPTFGPPRLGPDSLEEVPFLTEFGDWDQGRGTIEIPHSGIFYSPAIQDVYIRQMVNLLNHRNPYTGLTYAKDPVLWDIEIINEQSILFYTSPNALQRSPTLRRQVAERFSAWLKDRYTDDAGLVAAWGDGALGSFDWWRDESLADGTVLPIGNPWHWDPDNLAGSDSFRRQRNLDTLEFLTGLQLEFYERYVEAIRATGYEGEISGSNWQAGRAFSHFANLWTDAQVGTIDRHNYFGGFFNNQATGRREVRTDAMLARAGSGMLSTGMQQVKGLPFMFSEWIHVWPSEWGVEGPAIIGAYGLGLQGWDVSYMFQNRDQGRLSPRLGAEQWDVTAPQIMGIFPAVARQVLRGDVAPSDLRAHLNVHPPSLFKGEGLDFDDRVAQGYDEKSFETGKVGRRALAVARVQVRFTNEPQETPMFDITPFEKDGALVSSTGQLRWHEAPEEQARGGWFVIDTPGTQALVGFAENQSVETADAVIASRSPFGAFYLTALSPDGTIAGDDRVLVTAIGRARNTGQRFAEDGALLEEAGGEPVRLERIRATLTLKRPGTPVVRILDHDGRPTDRTLPVRDGRVEIDTGRDRTPYYVLDYSEAR
ncbi:MAG: hypothetical protein EA425_07720 [Puniceicoccaceae bacterium]|nr:MAG: hypothetical protein EA425_07720 [Puniceicoccaceae bacterium]